MQRRTASEKVLIARLRLSARGPVYGLRIAYACVRPLRVRMTIRSLDESLPLKWSNGSAGSTLAMVDVFGCLGSAKLGGCNIFISTFYRRCQQNMTLI